MRPDSSKPTGVRPAKSRSSPNALRRPSRPAVSGATRCRNKFLRHFPEGFRDESYLSLERQYKWETHLRWQSVLGFDKFKRLLDLGEFRVIATQAARVEQLSKHSMIFSFEKMALRDAIKSEEGVKAFSPRFIRLAAWDRSQADRHLFLKSLITRSAASKYGFDLLYRSRPNWDT